MKNKLTYIDDKRFYCRIFEEKDAVILFQKVSGMPQSLYANLSKAILNKIIQCPANTTIVITDLLQSNEIKDFEGIEQTLYVRVGENDLLIPSAMIPTIGTSILTLKDIHGREIARIERNSPSIARYIWIAFAVLLCISLAIMGVSMFNNSRRIDSNNLLYNKDIKEIANWEEALNQATSGNNSYTPFISSDAVSSLTIYFSSMREQAELNLNMVKYAGNYTSINLAADSISNAISSIVSYAKAQENNEIQRRSNNQAAYNADKQKISGMKAHLQTVISENKISGNILRSEAIYDIESELDNLEGTAELNYSNVEKSGVYQQVVIDTIEIMNKIAKLQQHGKVVKIQNDHHSSHSSSPSTMKLFNQLVQTANEDYKLFYRKNDKVAARRAISNYNKALAIKQDADVLKRKNQLKKALEE